MTASFNVRNILVALMVAGLLLLPVVRPWRARRNRGAALG